MEETFISEFTAMQFATNRNIRLHYKILGNGQPILLIPGLGLHSVPIARVAEELAISHRIIVVDPRGAGQSAKPDTPYTAEIFVEDMVAVLDAAGVDRADVVGISMGGMIGQELAIQRPERVRALVLAVTYAAADAWVKQMWELRQGLIERLGLTEHFKLALMFLFSPRSFESEAALIATMRAGFASNPPDQVGYLRQLAFCRDHDAISRLFQIEAPTLVLSGADDLIAPQHLGQQLAKGIPGAVLKVIANAPHLFMLSAPDQFAAIIREFLDRLGRA
jgi:3-oxoadipate enol-lactonase